MDFRTVPVSLGKRVMYLSDIWTVWENQVKESKKMDERIVKLARGLVQ